MKNVLNVLSNQVFPSFNKMALGASGLSLALFSGTALASTGVTGSEIVGGSGSIDNSIANQTHIYQDTNRLAIDHDTFDINTGELVQFHQPGASSIALNRVVGSQDPSQIMGTLKANGQVWLVNPNGIYFGKDSVVDVAGLLATTSNIDPNDFMQDKFFFEQGDVENAKIINDGHIEVGTIAEGSTMKQGGYAALVAPTVINRGVIKANMGQVVLSSITSASRFTVDTYGDGLINFEIPSRAPGANETQLVSNEGLISGGSVYLTADTVGEVVDSIVNMEGVIEASGLNEVDGQIVLDGGSGELSVSGTLNAAGGKVVATADKVTLTETASIDVSAEGDAGEAYVGGGWQGKDSAIRNASNTTVEQGATIKANSHVAGDGGTVVVWADEKTIFDGKIEATGGAVSGDGGNVETSGKDILQIAKGTVDASAANGLGGTWLLDPRNLWVSDLAFEGEIGDNSFVSTSSVEGTLNGGSNVILMTDDAGGADGDLGILDEIEKTAGGNATLTLQAHNDIYITADITSTSGELNVTMLGNAGANNLTFVDASIATNGGNVTFSSDSVAISDQVNTAGGNVNVNAQTLLLDGANGGSVATGGGDLLVSTNEALLSGEVTTSSGDVTINSSVVAISDELNTSGGQINANTNTFFIDGASGGSVASGGGAVNVTTDDAFILGSLSSSGGEVSVTADTAYIAGDITTSGGNFEAQTSTFVVDGDNGGLIATSGGNVDITTNSMTLIPDSGNLTAAVIDAGLGTVNIGRASFGTISLGVNQGGLYLSQDELITIVGENLAIGGDNTSTVFVEDVDTTTNIADSVTLEAGTGLVPLGNQGDVIFEGDSQFNRLNVAAQGDIRVTSTAGVTGFNGVTFNAGEAARSDAGNIEILGGLSSTNADISLTAFNNVNVTGALNSNGGAISLLSTDDDILIDGEVTSGGGNITLDAADDVEIGLVDSNAVVNSNGGSIVVNAGEDVESGGSIHSEGGAIDIDAGENFTMLAGARIQSEAGAIDITSNALTMGFASIIDSTDDTDPSGDITILTNSFNNFGFISAKDATLTLGRNDSQGAISLGDLAFGLHLNQNEIERMEAGTLVIGRSTAGVDTRVVVSNADLSEFDQTELNTDTPGTPTTNDNVSFFGTNKFKALTVNAADNIIINANAKVSANGEVIFNADQNGSGDGDFDMRADSLLETGGSDFTANVIDTDMSAGAQISTEGGNVTVNTNEIDLAAGSNINAAGGDILIDNAGIFTSGADTLTTNNNGTIALNQHDGGSIQDAVDALDHMGAGNKSTIYVGDGEFNEQVEIDHAVSLIGNGATNTTLINVADNTTGFTVVTSDVSITGFRFEANGSGTGTTAIEVDSTGGNINDIAIGEGSSSTDNVFAGLETAIAANGDGLKGLAIDGNTFDGVGTGVAIDGSLDAATISIANNIFGYADDGVTESAVTGDAIAVSGELANSSIVSIDGNTILSAGEGVNISGALVDSEVMIDSNSIDAQGNAIIIAGGEHTGNSTVEITNNTKLDAATGDAVYVSDVTAGGLEVTVSGHGAAAITAGDDGVELVNVDAATINDNTIDGVGDVAVLLTDTSNADVYDNTITNAATAGVEVTGGESINIGLVGDGNLFSGSPVGVSISGSETVVIQENDFDTATTAISIADAATNVDILNNVITTSDTGVNITGGSSNVIANGNTINTSGGVVGISVDTAGADIDLTDNIITGDNTAGTIGISVVDTDGVDIDGGSITGQETGVFVDPSQFVTITNLTLGNNASYGIQAIEADNLLISGNNISGSQIAIEVSQSNDITIESNEITDSNSAIVLSEVGGASNVSDNDIYLISGNAITVANSTGVNIDDNLLAGIEGDAVTVTDSSDTVISDNLIAGIGGTGISVTDSESTTITGNQLLAVLGGGIRVENLSTTSGDLEISDNDLVLIGGDAIYASLNGAKGVAITGNEIAVTDERGIVLLDAKDANVSANTLGAIGVGFSDWLGTSFDLSDGLQYAISLDQTGTDFEDLFTTIEGFIDFPNDIITVPFGESDGIFISGVSAEDNVLGLSVNNNTVFGVGGNGIVVENSSDVEAKGNVVDYVGITSASWDLNDILAINPNDVVDGLDDVANNILSLEDFVLAIAPEPIDFTMEEASAVKLSGVENASLEGNELSNATYGMHILDSENVTVTGDGNDTTVDISNVLYGVEVRGETDGVLIDGVNIDNALAAGVRIKDATVENVEVINSTVDTTDLVNVAGILVDEAGENIVLTDNEIIGNNTANTIGIVIADTDGVNVSGGSVENQNIGIYIDPSADVVVDGVMLTDNTAYGVLADEANGVNIVNNIISGSGDGVSVLNSENVTVSDNDISNITNTAIRLTDVDGATVSANQIDTALVGVRVRDSNDVTVEGDGNALIADITNVAYGVSVRGESDNVLIDSVDIDAASLAGIRLKDTTVTNVVVNNNSVDTTGQVNASGIVVDKAGANSITLTDNNITGNNSADTVGIIIADTDGVNVSGGSVENQNIGIYIDPSEDVVVNGVTIADNTRYGILAEETDGLEISDNTISGSLFAGVSVVDSDGVSISGNNISDITATGVLLTNVTNSVVEGDGNTLSDDISDVRYGVSIRGVSDTVSVVGMNISKASFAGVRLKDSTVANVTVDSNIIDTTDQVDATAIVVDKVGSGIDISSNTIIGNNASGTEGVDIIETDGVLVDGNTISGQEAAIIADTSNSLTISDNTLSNNSEYGVLVGDSDNLVIQGNTVSGSNIGIAAIGADAVDLPGTFDGTLNVLVDGNNVTTSGDNGIVVSGSTLEVALTDNVVAIVPGAFGSGSQSGVAVTDGASATVSGNTVSVSGVTSENEDLTLLAIENAASGVVLADNTLNGVTGGSETLIGILESSDVELDANELNGGATGLKLDGLAASATLTSENVFASNGFYVRLENGAMDGQILDVSQSTFDGLFAATMNIPQTVAAEGITLDAEDVSGVGDVFYNNSRNITVLQEAFGNRDNGFGPNLSYAGETIPTPNSLSPTSLSSLDLDLSLLSEASLAGLSPAELAQLAPAAGGQNDNAVACANGYLSGGFRANFDTASCQ